MCGLKQKECNIKPDDTSVTPFVGVWIETYSISLSTQFCVVTPFVGVWIETERNAGKK